MIRQQHAVLKVHSLEYLSGTGLNLMLPLDRDIRKALAVADRTGRFSIEGYEMLLDKKMPTEHSGRIVKIGFQGIRNLTQTELDNLPFEPDDKFDVEAVTYSFRQWVKEGRPLKLMLKRREEYYPPRV